MEMSGCKAVDNGVEHIFVMALTGLPSLCMVD